MPIYDYRAILDQISDQLADLIQKQTITNTLLQNIDFHKITVFLGICAICLAINCFIKKGWLF